MKAHFSLGPLRPAFRRHALPTLCALAMLGDAGRADPLVLFETGFEKFEGYQPGADLIGQNNWIGFGEGGNGILSEPLAGFQGQYAYIGFIAPPAQQKDPFNLWRPVNLKPVGSALPVVQFTVSFQIEDSTTAAPYFDDFRWSAYSVDSHRFFTLDFDNDTQTINFILDDATANQAPPIRATGFAFHSDEPYDLVMTMDFARNLWSAKINGVVVVNAQPITTTGAKLTFGDMDAVWAIRTPGRPGDNYMIFDDYRIVATDLADIPPEVEISGPPDPNGNIVVRVLGEPGVTYALEATGNFGDWEQVATAKVTSPDGVVDFVEHVEAGRPARFYRANSRP